MKSWEYLENKHKVKTRNKRWDRRLTSKRKLNERKYLITNGCLFDRHKNRLMITAPTAICIYLDNFTKNTIRFIGKVREEARIRKNIHIDFSKVTHISAAAMLLLLATVDHIKRTMIDVKISARYPKSDKSESIFNQIGFTRILGRKERDTKKYDDVSFWGTTTGNDTRPEQSLQLFREIDKALPESRKLLYKGFLEAMANTVEHAYAHLNSSHLSRHSRWWAFGGIWDNRVILLICDLGAGIPKTLPKVIEPSWLDRTLNKIGVSTHHDAEMIQVATMLRETATKQQNRGKGLHDAKKSVEHVPGSLLSIHSNRGNYRYHHLRSGKKVGELRRLNDSIGGTIVEWELPLGDTV